MNNTYGLVSTLAALAFAIGCASSEPPPKSAPLPLPPVQCTDYPSSQQDVVSCRYGSASQINEVWARSTQLAAVSAISLGATHIQWLSAQTNVDTVHADSPVQCKPSMGAIDCYGGPYEMPVGFVATTRFAILSAAEANARSSDPLIPPERRPLDAHRIAAATAH